MIGVRRGSIRPGTKRPPTEAVLGMSPGAATTTGASVALGGIWSAAGEVAPQLSGLAVSIAGARFLGPDGLGRQSFIAFVVTSAQNVFALGVPIALMRSGSELIGAGRHEEARGLVGWAWRVAAVGSFVAFGVLTCVALAGGEPQVAWVLAAITAGVGVVTAIPGSILKAMQQWRALARVIAIANAAGAVTTIGVLALGGGVTGMIAVQLGVAVAILGAVATLARRRLAVIAPAAVPTGATKRKMVRLSGAYLVGSLITLIVFRRSELFFLEHYASDREVALYSVAFGAVTMLVLVPQALAGVVSPAVATLLGGGEHGRIRAGYARALRLLLVAALPVTAGALALGPATLTLVFGTQFAGTKLPLLLLLLSFPLIPLMNVSYWLVVGLGKTRFPFVAGLGSAALNIALDFTLIPDHGAVGAAVANVCAQGATAVATIVYANGLVGPVRWDAGRLARAFVCSAAAGTTALALVELFGGLEGVVAGACAGCAAFVALGVLLKIISRDDFRWLSGAFGQRIGVLARHFAAKA
jgi:O-antigen/teichoic acid export membrane protein